ncbi:ABC transporter permease [Haliovirga abyssi]|uniref:Diguanylate cyclase n=1 Tax=Haliovirga abyssi TaxID=2996794 RepID=A0AAU9D8Q4_9FUSO|nr:ABC transporter permease [Haliovirga abyssi]BDU49645.1 diguanylate cyclase [Haliovirga abyssi]
MKNLDFTLVGKNLEESEKIYKPSLTYWKDVWRRLKQNKAAMFFLVSLVVLIIMAIIGPYLNKYDFREQHLDWQYKFWDKASFEKGFFFGTDDFGRDMFTRIWEGGRISFTIAFVVVFIEGVVGTLYGGIAGYFGGKIDFYMMRFVEIMMAVPSIIYIILLMVVMGAGVNTIIIAMGLTTWMVMAMIVRGEVIKIKQQEFVMASVALGASSFRIILRHLIPNAMGQIIVRLTLDIPSAIFTEAFLSFIGIGVPAPIASWGSLANNGYQLLAVAPHLFILPALFISFTTMAFNIVGDALRDAMDPKLRK